MENDEFYKSMRNLVTAKEHLKQNEAFSDLQNMISTSFTIEGLNQVSVAGT